MKYGLPKWSGIAARLSLLTACAAAPLFGTAPSPEPSRLPEALKGAPSAAEAQLNTADLDTSLLIDLLTLYTNRERVRRNLEACTFRPRLSEAAQAHSENMVKHRFFGHDSPVPGQRTLTDRMRRSGVILENTIVGENVAVDFILAIAGIPFYRENEGGETVYYEHRTGRRIPVQTYSRFARHMVRSWMQSPGHRENILNPRFNTIGFGIAAGPYQGLPALYVTQVFQGDLRTAHP